MGILEYRNKINDGYPGVQKDKFEDTTAVISKHRMV